MFSNKEKTQKTKVMEINVVAKNTTINGDIISEGDFRIDGTLEGNIKTKGRVIIGIDGSVKGKIDAVNSDIEGKFSGELLVQETLTIKATATISGAAGLPKHCPPQLELKVFGSEGMLLLDLEEGRERLQIRRFDKKDTIEPFELGEGYGSYSTQESVNRFIELCLGREARNCGDHLVGLKTVQVLEAMYDSISIGETVKCG